MEMAYNNNFGDGAQPQQGQEEPGNYGGPGAQQQHPMGQMGQQMDPSQQQSPFPGAQPGAQGSPGGDQKTTLWYVPFLFSVRYVTNALQDGRARALD